MSTNHNRIKVADLEKNEPNKTLITNDNGELEFSDITGGVQDLQSVLINGNIAYGSRASGGASTLLMNPDAQNSYSNNFFIYRGLTDSSIYQDPLQIYIDNRNSIGGSRIRTSTSGIEISQELTDVGKTTVKISDPIANTTINFPAKPEGTYTLATTEDVGGSQDDITMQKLIETSTDVDNRTAYYDSGSTYADQRAIGFKGSTEDGTELSSELGIDHIYMISTSGTTTDYITTNYGTYALGRSINGGANWNTALRYDGIYFQDNDATQNLSILFPKLRAGGPLAIKTMPLSVNGEFADDNGNIVLSGGGSATFQEIVNNITNSDNYIAYHDAGEDDTLIRGIGFKYTYPTENIQNNSSFTFEGLQSVTTEGSIQKNSSLQSHSLQLGVLDSDTNRVATNKYDRLTLFKQGYEGETYFTRFLNIMYPDLKEEDGEFSEFLPLSVNGVFADSKGNIELSRGTQDLQSVLNNGGTASLVNEDSTKYNAVDINPLQTVFTTGSADRVSSMLTTENSATMAVYDFVNSGQVFFSLTDPDPITTITSYSLPKNKPNGNYHLAVSVNGNLADETGNIEISGGSQDLQSVIENGSFATLSSGGKVTFEDPDTFNKTKISGDKIEITIDNNGDSATLNPTELSFTKSDTYVQFNKEGIKYTNDDGGLVKLAFGDIIDDNNITLKIPSHLTTGTYTFATLEEISDNFVHKTGEVTEIIDGNKIFRFPATFRGDASSSYIRIDSDYLTFTTEAYDNNSIKLIAKQNSGAENENYTQELQAKDGVIALLDDIAVSNSTTTSLSNSNLNSTYPTANIGFRVHCTSISAGALTYEKTASGWIQYAVTVVV